MNPRIIGDARARAELEASRRRIEAGMAHVRREHKLTFAQELERELERNARVRQLLQDLHARVLYANQCGNVVWADSDLLQRISEAIMEAKR